MRNWIGLIPDAVVWSAGPGGCSPDQLPGLICADLFVQRRLEAVPTGGRVAVCVLREHARWHGIPAVASMSKSEPFRVAFYFDHGSGYCLWPANDRTSQIFGYLAGSKGFRRS